MQAIKIIANSELTIDLLNLYNPNENIPCSVYDFYFKQLDTNMIIVGDFNCYHRMWNTRRSSNTAGVNLVDALVLHSSITLLTPTSLPTYYNINSGNFSTLDLTFVAAQIYPISQFVLGKDIGSDHYPVMITIAIKPSITKFKARKRWKFETGSWDHWSKQQPAVEKHDINLNFSDSCNNFVKCLIETSAVCFKQTKEEVTPRYSKPWWTPRCAELVALKRAAKSRHSRHPTLVNLLAFKRSEALVKREVREAKKASWQKYCNEITFSTSTAAVWNRVGRLKNKFILKTSPIITMSDILTDPKSKADAIADKYE